MHQWTTKTAMTFAGTADQDYKDLMTITTVELAFEHDAFLYALCSFSALHIARTAKDAPRREEAMISYRRYLDMALREHQVDIANLRKTNADTVCLTSSMVRSPKPSFSRIRASCVLLSRIKSHSFNLIISHN